MTKEKPSRRRSAADDRAGPLWLGVTPAVLYLAHVLGGANQLAHAQWFVLVLSTLLLATLLAPRARYVLTRIKTVRPVASCYLAVMVAAVWSLTPFTPAGPHAVWAATGHAPGVGTLNPSATILEIVKLGGLACVFVVGCAQGAIRRKARTTVEIILGLGAIYAVFALVTFLLGVQIKAGRLTGGFLSPNSAATVFGVLTLIGLGGVTRRLRRSAHAVRSKQLAAVAPPVICVLLFVICLILSASRMGVAATALAASILLVWELSLRRSRRLVKLVGAVAIIVSVGLVVSGGADVLWGRIDDVDFDAANRAAILAAHWKAFAASPFFGHGLGSFVDVNSLIMAEDNYAALWSIRATHNVYLQWLEEAGLIGAAPMFGLVGVLIVSSARRAAVARSGGELIRALVAANAVVLAHGFTDYALQVPSIAAFWSFLLGLQFAYGRARFRRRNSRRERRKKSGRNGQALSEKREISAMNAS